MPIYPIEVRGPGIPTYDYAALAAYLGNLHFMLDASAKALLAENGLAENGYDDLQSASQKLLTLPKLISKKFDPSASKNVLNGMMMDVVDLLQPTSTTGTHIV